MPRTPQRTLQTRELPGTVEPECASFCQIRSYLVQPQVWLKELWYILLWLDSIVTYICNDVAAAHRYLSKHHFQKLNHVQIWRNVNTIGIAIFAWNLNINLLKMENHPWRWSLVCIGPSLESPEKNPDEENRLIGVVFWRWPLTMTIKRWGWGRWWWCLLAVWLYIIADDDDYDCHCLRVLGTATMSTRTMQYYSLLGNSWGLKSPVVASVLVKASMVLTLQNKRFSPCPWPLELRINPVSKAAICGWKQLPNFPQDFMELSPMEVTPAEPSRPHTPSSASGDGASVKWRIT